MQLMRSGFPKTVLLLALASLLQAPSARAQQTASDTLNPVPVAPVTVTVLRTPFSLSEVPFAVAVNGEEQIQRAQPGLGLDEALRGIPGVQVDNRFNYALGERISIRGFGARAQFGVRGIKVFVDGIPATFPDGQTALNHVDLSLLSRAEVIRGPASAIYGNTAGGVIQLETEAPPEARLGQEVGVLGGSDGLLRVHSTTGGRTGAASYLFHASRLAYDGYRDFSSTENLRVNGRVGLTRGRNDLRVLFSIVDYDAQNPGSLSETLLKADRSQAFTRNREQQTGEEGRQGQIGTTFRRQMNAGEMELTGYWLTRSIDNPIPNTIIDLDRRAAGVRALFRSRALPVLGLQGTIGAETDLQRDDRLNFANQRGERGALTLDQREGVNNAGLFAQLSATPLARLNLLGGIRYDWFRFRADDRLITATNPDDSGSRTLDAISPSLGASFTVLDGLNVYANVATSFETPTTTELANRPSGAGGFNPDLEPQRAVSTEAGAKGEFGGWIAYQLSAYRADIEDALIPFEVPQAPGRQFFRNAGSTVHQGVELAATVAPLSGVTLQGTYTRTDARFRDYTVRNRSFADNQVPGIAPHRAEITLSYEQPRLWFATLQGRYASRTPVDDANTTHSPSYTVTDLRTGLQGVSIGRLRVAPFLGVTNLFDEEYNTSVVINAFGQRFFEPGPGRSFYTGLTVRF